MNGNVRIRREERGFILFRRHARTHEITESLTVGDEMELRNLADSLRETADAFDAVKAALTPDTDRGKAP